MVAATSVIEAVRYRPSEDEPYMSDRQQRYFRGKLLAWKEDILRESRSTVGHLQAETVNHADDADRATCETDRAWSCARATASAS
jgi:DnaK suppressor protein